MQGFEQDPFQSGILAVGQGLISKTEDDERNRSYFIGPSFYGELTCEEPYCLS